MNLAEIIAISQIVGQLAPPALEFANNIIKALDASGMSGEDRMKAILEMQATLKPMEPIAE